MDAVRWVAGLACAAGTGVGRRVVAFSRWVDGRWPVRWFAAGVFALLVGFAGIAQPMHNWDMIGYVASAYRADGLDGEALRAHTFDDIRAEANPREFRSLTTDVYDSEVYRSARALGQQVPFYAVRVIYVELIRCVHQRFGYGYAAASVRVSAVFAALAVLMLAALMRWQRLPILLLPGVAYLSGFVEVAQQSTPDSVACCAALAALWLALKRNPLLLPLVVLLPLIRTDYILLSALLMLEEWLAGRRAPAALALVAATLAYFWTNQAHGHYGWLRTFNFANIGITAYPADMVVSTRLPDYLWPYLLALRNLFDQTAQGALFLCTLVALARLPGAGFGDRQMRLLALYPLAFVALHLLVFPHFESRFFVFAAAATALVLLHGLRGITTDDRPVAQSR